MAHGVYEYRYSGREPVYSCSVKAMGRGPDVVEELVTKVQVYTELLNRILTGQTAVEYHCVVLLVKHPWEGRRPSTHSLQREGYGKEFHGSAGSTARLRNGDGAVAVTAFSA